MAARCGYYRPAKPPRFAKIDGERRQLYICEGCGERVWAYVPPRPRCRHKSHGGQHENPFPDQEFSTQAEQRQ